MDKDAQKTAGIGQRIIPIVLPVVAISMALYQIISTQYLIQDPVAHRITHFGFAAVVVILALKVQNTRDWVLKLAILLGAVVIVLYFRISLYEILLYRSTIPSTSDLVMGILLVLILIAVAYRAYGLTFPILAAVSIAYVYFGRYLPHPFNVASVPVKRIIVWLTTPGIEEGIFGDLLAISCNELFLFLLFGGMLEVFGATRFIMGVGGWFASKLRCGPAAMPVFSDILLGEITGSTVASIVITGSYTIPLMKKAGYSPAQAGAIETVTSNGGQIMPPVMGATAFVMAGFAGIPYSEIAVAAIFPALLYYFGVYCYVQIQASKMPLVSVVNPVSGKQLLFDSPVFVIPLGVLVFFLVKGFALPTVCFWSIVSLVVVGLLNSIRKDYRLSFKGVMEDVSSGVRSASEMAVVIALIGVVATCIKVSGLGIRLPLIVADISHGFLIIALVMTMFSSILLGMGVPTPVAYMLVAIGAVPALRGMGVGPLQAHLFCFLFAVYSHITPPVALGSMVASQIAGARYWPTAWEAVKAGGTAFVLPYLIIYCPIVILRPDVSFAYGLVEIVIILLMILSTQMALSNYSMIDLTFPEKLGYFIITLFCLIGLFGEGVPFILAGAALFVLNISKQFLRRRTLRSMITQKSPTS